MASLVSNHTRAGMMWWRPSLRQSYCLSCQGLMHCPLGAGQKGLGGRCQVLTKSVHNFSVTSIYTSYKYLRNTDSYTDDILYVFTHPFVCVRVCVCTWPCMHTYIHILRHVLILSTPRITIEHIFNQYYSLFSSKGATATKQAKNSAYVKNKISCMHW